MHGRSTCHLEWDLDRSHLIAVSYWDSRLTTFPVHRLTGLLANATEVYADRATFLAIIEKFGLISFNHVKPAFRFRIERVYDEHMTLLAAWNPAWAEFGRAATMFDNGNGTTSAPRAVPLDQSLATYVVFRDLPQGIGGTAVSYTHLTLPTNREV